MSFAKDDDDDEVGGGFGGTSAAAAVAAEVALEALVAASTGGAGGSREEEVDGDPPVAFAPSAAVVAPDAAAGSLLLSLLRAGDDDDEGSSRALVFDPGRRLSGGGALRAGDGATRPTDDDEVEVEEGGAAALVSDGAFSLARGLAGTKGLRRGLLSLTELSAVSPTPMAAAVVPAVPAASSFLEAPFWLLLLVLLLPLLRAGSVNAAVALPRSRLASALLSGEDCGRKRPLLAPPALLLLLLLGRMEGAAALRVGGSDRGADPSRDVAPPPVALPTRSPPRGVSPLLPEPPPLPFTGSRPNAAGGLALGLES